jgi:hypothetical protein
VRVTGTTNGSERELLTEASGTDECGYLVGSASVQAMAMVP